MASRHERCRGGIALEQSRAAASVDQEVEVESDAGAIEDLIWRYNDAVESARAAWLRDDLPHPVLERIYPMRRPLSFGLPRFTDQQQADRDQKLELQIHRRLYGRDVTISRYIVAMQILESAGNAAGIALGGGVVVAAAKKGGKWAVVKTIAVAVAEEAAGRAAERIAASAGASEQTLQGIQLAVAVVNLILRHRSSGAQGAEPVSRATPDRSGGKAKQDAKAPAKQPPEQPRGDPEVAAQAAPTQPYGPHHRGATPAKRRLPAVGTPERAAIETARRRGIRKAKEIELENILAGGKGSGVWSQVELQQIRETGNFPADVRWHHDPTVANRPDLAADPSVIRPVRGGTQGHLEAHGGDFRKP